MIFFAASFLSILIKLKFKKGNSGESFRLHDKINLIYKHLKINRKYIILSILGLVVASLIISHSIILDASYTQISFEGYIKNKDDTALNILIDKLPTKEDLNHWESIIESKVNSLPSEYNLELDNYYITSSFEVRVSYGDPVLIVEQDYMGHLWDYYQPHIIVDQLDLDGDFLNKLKKLPTFTYDGEYNSSTNILIVPRVKNINFTEIVVNDEIQLLSGSMYAEPGDSFSLYNYNISYVWQISEIDYQLMELINLRFDNAIFTKGVLLTPADDKWVLYDHILESGGDILFAPPIKSSTNIFIVIPILADNSLDILKSSLIQLKQGSLTWAASISSIKSFSVRSPLYNIIIDYKLSTESNINILLQIATGPLIGISLFLMYFAITLVEERKNKIIAIMKIRGISRDQLNSVLISEVIAGGILAVGVGMVLSIPWTLFSIGSLSSFEISNDLLVIPISWYWRLPFIGVILALDLNIYGILGLIKLSIDSEFSTRAKKTAFWQKINLDLIFTAISVIFWFVIDFIPFENQYSRISLIKVFGPIMLIIFLIGLPLVITRYFPDLIGKISDVFWKYHAGMMSFATRSLKNNKFLSSRLSALLIMGMMLSFTTLVIPISYYHWNHEQAYYEVGSDLYIEGIDTSNKTRLGQIYNIKGVTGYTEIAKLSLKYTTRNIDFLGIDSPTFANASYWEEFYDSKSLENITSFISDNSSIGMQYGSMNSLGLNIGDKFTFNRGSDTFTYNISTHFEYFPNLVFSIPTPDINGIYDSTNTAILMSLDALENLYGGSSSLKKGIYIKVNSTEHIPEITQSLYKLFFDTTLLIKSAHQVELDGLESNQAKIIITTLNGMFFISLLTTVIAMIFFSIVTLTERKRELAIYRAFGMIRSQISKMLIFEGMILLALAFFVGGLSGLFLSKSFLQLISHSFNEKAFLKLRLFLPLETLSIFAFNILILVLVTAIIPAFSISRRKVGSILRAE